MTAPVRNIRILLRDDPELRAFVRIDFADGTSVRGLKIIIGPDGAMLVRPGRTGQPIQPDDPDAWIRNMILDAFNDRDGGAGCGALV